jgi:hypothetical protein
MIRISLKLKLKQDCPLEIKERLLKYSSMENGNLLQKFLEWVEPYIENGFVGDVLSENQTSMIKKGANGIVFNTGYFDCND